MLWVKTMASCRRQVAGGTGTWWVRCAKADNSRLEGVYIKPDSQLHEFSLKKAKKGGNGKRIGSKPVRLQQSWTLTAEVVEGPCKHISISVKRPLQNLIPVRPRALRIKRQHLMLAVASGLSYTHVASCSLFHNKLSPREGSITIWTLTEPFRWEVTLSQIGHSMPSCTASGSHRTCR